MKLPASGKKQTSAAKSSKSVDKSDEGVKHTEMKSAETDAAAAEQSLLFSIPRDAKIPNDRYMMQGSVDDAARESDIPKIPAISAAALAPPLAEASRTKRNAKALPTEKPPGRVKPYAATEISAEKAKNESARCFGCAGEALLRLKIYEKNVAALTSKAESAVS